MQHQGYYRVLPAANLRGLTVLNSVVFLTFRDVYLLVKLQTTTVFYFTEEILCFDIACTSSEPRTRFVLIAIDSYLVSKRLGEIWSRES